MSERRFSVTLAARIDQYVAAMNAAKAATGSFSAQTERNLKTVGGQMVSVGKKMTAGVTLPLVGLGVAAVKMSSDFERTFSQMVGLAGVPADEIDHLKASVLDLSSATGVSAQQIADSLYSAASAGLNSAEALDAVTVAAYGSAAGLGSAEDIVSLVASALASYGSANIDAARATDILTATIRAGRADPDELAGSLGRILPIAANLGVGFEQVGGLAAYLSNVMGHTGRTVTSLSGFFTKLMSPTKQGREALKDMGTSLEELQDVIRNDGVLGALDLLREKGFGENRIALKALFEDQEALVGAMALIEDRSGTLTATMAEVANSSGALGEAFDVVADDKGFKMRQSFERMKNAMIQAGDIIIPLAAKVAEWVGRMAEAFGDLPAPVQTAVIGVLGFAAAAGPLLIAAGSIIHNLKELRAVSALVGPKLAAMGPYMLGAAAAAGLAYAAYQHFTSAKREMTARTREVVPLLRDATDAIIAESHAAVLAAGTTEGMALAQRALSAALTASEGDGERLTRALGALGMQTSDAAKLLIDMGRDPVDALARAGREAGLSAKEAEYLARAVNGTNDSMDGWIKGYGHMRGAVEALNPGLKELRHEIEANRKGAEFWTPEMQRAAEAMEEVADQRDKTDLESMAQEMIDLAVAASPVHEELVKQARAMEGADASAVEVYSTYVDLAAASEDLAAGTTSVADASNWAADALDVFGWSGSAAAADVAELSEAEEALLEQMEKAAETALRYREILAGSDWGGAAFNAAETAFADYREELFGLGNFIQEKTAAWKAFKEAVDGGSLSLDTATKKGAAQQDALEQVAKVLDTQFARAWEEANGNLDAFERHATQIADEALASLKKEAGLSAEEVEALARQLGLTPEQIRTRIEIAGDEEARIKLGLLQGLMDGLSEGVEAEVRQKIIEGDYQGALDAMQRDLDQQALEVDEVGVPGDVTTTHRAQQRWFDRNPWSVAANARQGSWFPTWETLRNNFNSRPVSSPVNARNGLWAPTWSAMNAWFGARPTSVRTNAVVGAVSTARNQIQSWLFGNPVTVSVNARKGWGWDSLLNMFGSHATGGLIGASERISLVGERGPELVSLPAGSRVHTAAETRQMFQGMGSLSSGRELGLAPSPAPAPAAPWEPLVGELHVGSRSDLNDAMHALDDLIWQVRARR